MQDILLAAGIICIAISGVALIWWLLANYPPVGFTVIFALGVLFLFLAIFTV